MNAITNNVQYRSTKAHLRRFDDALANLEAAVGAEPTKREQLEIDAVRAQAEDLRSELADYERLASGAVDTFEASTLAGIATILIEARVARGRSQRQLAEALGVAEEQVQRYDASGYRSASLARIADVAEALRVDITGTARLRGPQHAA